MASNQVPSTLSWMLEVTMFTFIHENETCCMITKLNCKDLCQSLKSIRLMLSKITYKPNVNGHSINETPKKYSLQFNEEAGLDSLWLK